jgi:predicted GNAT superfamily acetyltransferase
VETIIRLRPAEPSDYDRIVPVMDGWWGRSVHGGLPRLFLDHFAHTSLIAEWDGDLAGFLVGFLSPSQPDVAYIHFVGVSPDHRGSGLARRLYMSFFDLARAGGRTVVRAITSPQNEASIAFHQAVGFTVTGPVTDYDGPGTDRVRFERSLAP